MPTLLFSLRGVPDDEADEIRELLNSSDIAFYETDAGNWGISTPALWINSSDQLTQAQELLYEYHKQRAITQRQLYIELKETKKNKRLIQNIIDTPLQFTLYLGGIVFILYISIKVIFEFGL